MAVSQNRDITSTMIVMVDDVGMANLREKESMLYVDMLPKRL